MSEEEEICTALVKDVSEEEPTEIVFHAEQDTNDMVMHRKMHIATGVVFSFLFFITAILALDAVSQVRGWHYSAPLWFIDLCKMSIGSALVVLGLSGLGIIKNIDRK